MRTYWDVDKIAEVLRDHLRNRQGENEIHTIITFDKHGISNHPNHIAVHNGVAKVFGE
jgi:LmbE family N-acetylglucosaminyl deacetylase